MAAAAQPAQASKPDSEMKSDDQSADALWFSAKYAKGMLCMKEPGYEVTARITWVSVTWATADVLDWQYDKKITIHANCNFNYRKIEAGKLIDVFATWCYHHEKWIGYGLRIKNETGRRLFGPKPDPYAEPEPDPQADPPPGIPTPPAPATVPQEFQAFPPSAAPRGQEGESGGGGSNVLFFNSRGSGRPMSSAPTTSPLGKANQTSFRIIELCSFYLSPKN